MNDYSEYPTIKIEKEEKTPFEQALDKINQAANLDRLRLIQLKKAFIELKQVHHIQSHWLSNQERHESDIWRDCIEATCVNAKQLLEKLELE